MKRKSDVNSFIQSKTILSESEKKQNHVDSEKKRRQNIKIGFERLVEAVPSLKEGQRSESIILQNCN